MNFENELNKIGISPKESLRIEERNRIARNITDKLTTNVKELVDDYNELFMRIANCNMYYAEIDEKFKGIFYFYKNNSIYIDKDFLGVNEYLIHEVIHYLQNFDKVNKEIKRAGLCQFLEFKLWGLGINEAVVQYITLKAEGHNIQRVNDSKTSICTNSENNYKYMTSLITEVLLFMGEGKAIESCIKSTETFETELYNTFEDNTEKIVKGFDDLLEESTKENKDEEKIINIYMSTQETIYKTYFKNMYKRLNSTKEVDNQVQKLEDFENIFGKTFEKYEWENSFTVFKKEMESNYLKKYIELNRKNKNSLMIVYKNVISNFFIRIADFINNKIIKSKLD